MRSGTSRAACAVRVLRLEQPFYPGLDGSRARREGDAPRPRGAMTSLADLKRAIVAFGPSVCTARPSVSLEHATSGRPSRRRGPVALSRSASVAAPRRCSGRAGAVGAGGDTRASLGRRGAAAELGLGCGGGADLPVACREHSGTISSLVTRPLGAASTSVPKVTGDVLPAHDGAGALLLFSSGVRTISMTAWTVSCGQSRLQLDREGDPAEAAAVASRGQGRRGGLG